MRAEGTEAAVRAVEAEKGEAAASHMYKSKLGPVPKLGVEGVVVLFSVPQTRLSACVSTSETPVTVTAVMTANTSTHAAHVCYCKVR